MHFGDICWATRRNKSTSFGKEDQSKRRPRVPCPYHAKHTVYADMLEKHMKICNSRKKENPVYFEESINLDQDTESQETRELGLASFSKEEVQSIIQKLQRLEKVLSLEADESILTHKALEEELVKEENGQSAQKHLLQIASLLGNMEKSQMMKAGTCFVEFGAGRGRLSQWVYTAQEDITDSHFILVDRSKVRRKRDRYYRSMDENLSLERIFVDIKDLNLGKVSAVSEHPKRPVVAYCKHLCGCATDLALRCSLSSSHTRLPSTTNPEEVSSNTSCSNHGDAGHHHGNLNIRGVAMALCCHHQCKWNSYVGKEYLASQGFSRREFGALIRMGSWAVCGTRRDKESSGNEGTEEDRGHGDEHGTSGIGEAETKETFTSALGLSIAEREQIGRLCKRLLDVGRREFLTKAGLKASLVEYVDKSVTLENTLLIGIKVDAEHDQRS